MSTSKLILILPLFFIFINCTQNKTLTQDDENSETFVNENFINKYVTVEETSEIVQQLSSDEFQGRKPSTPAYTKTLNYVSNYLSSNGIQPFYGNDLRNSCPVNGTTSYNIVGLIGDKNHSKEHILIGAHLDHLGTSQNPNDSIYNGANDNASGVTAVLQIAKELQKQDLDKNVIIALFTGEESGLVGSKYLAQQMKDENINISYMLNFEMLGKTLTSGKDKVYLTGYNKSNLAQVTNDLIEFEFVEFLPKAKSMSLFYRSDNFPFFDTFHIPAHTLSTFDFRNYDHYHKESDEFQELDVENMNSIINISIDVIRKLIDNDVSIELK